MAALIQRVVGELEFLEGDGLLQQLVAGEGRVGVEVEAGGKRWIGLAGHEPRRPVIGVAVALGVDRDNVQQHGVLDIGLDAGETHAQRRKHSPATPTQTVLFALFISINHQPEYNINLHNNNEKNAQRDTNTARWL